MSFSQDDQSIVCSFFNQPTATLKNCSANITYGSNCDQLLGVYSTETSGNTLRTPPLVTRADTTEYCYVVTATSSNVTVMVEGIFTDIGIYLKSVVHQYEICKHLNFELSDSGSSNLNIAAIATPVIILIVVLLITIVFLFLLLGYKVQQNRKMSEYIVKFSVTDEVGSLAKVLKVFKVTP